MWLLRKLLPWSDRATNAFIAEQSRRQIQDETTTILMEELMRAIHDGEADHVLALSEEDDE